MIALSEREKRERFLRIKSMWSACTRCPLHVGRSRVVLWRGSFDGKLGFVGEGPGADEDEQGVPFVGKAGKLLDDILTSLGLDEKDFFITNIVACRPPKNRAPTWEEAQACHPRLAAQLAIVQPRALVLLGNTPLLHLAGQTGITRWRGQELSARLRWKGETTIVPAVGTFHPAYLLRERSQEARDAVAEDIRLAAKLAGVYL